MGNLAVTLTASRGVCSMGADPIIYCLQELTDYDQFERLCHDLMIALGYQNIEPLGGFKDKGRDAVYVSRSTGETTIFAYSVREDWQKKLTEDASKISAHGHTCHELVFVTTEKPTNAERDEATASISRQYGWSLDVFGVERLRCLLSSAHPGLITMHPQIFHPSLFAQPDDLVRKADLRVHVSPTRSGRRQMAQIRLFNRGTGPIYVDSWHAAWGPEGHCSAVSSADCARGSLPIRLQEQDAYDFLVWLDDHRVDDLNQLGVRDGEGHLWLAEEQNIRTFIATALFHRPPEPTRRALTAEEIAGSDVTITVHREARAGESDILEVVFRNNGAVTIPLHGAEIQWKYDPPRELPSEEGEPTVAEVAASVNLAARRRDLVVQPGGERRFHVRDDMAAALVAVLADDVAEDDIAVVVHTTTELAWRVTGDEVPAEVCAYARSVVASWDP